MLCLFHQTNVTYCESLWITASAERPERVKRVPVTRGALQLSLGKTRPPKVLMASRTLEVNSGNSGAWWVKAQHVSDVPGHHQVGRSVQQRTSRVADITPTRDVRRG